MPEDSGPPQRVRRVQADADALLDIPPELPAELADRTPRRRK
ncbi:MAG: hypothetical protein Q7T26_09435 [Dehalococcoidia bacterium]|nr:hypothetical protein [Dehalococcoidia bacterium]